MSTHLRSVSVLSAPPARAVVGSVAGSADEAAMAELQNQIKHDNIATSRWQRRLVSVCCAYGGE